MSSSLPVTRPPMRESTPSTGDATADPINKAPTANAQPLIFRRESSDAAAAATIPSGDPSLSATVVIGQHSPSSTGTAIVHDSLSDTVVTTHLSRHGNGTGTGGGSNGDHGTHASESDVGSVIVHQTPMSGAISPRWGELLGKSAAGARRQAGASRQAGTYDSTDDDHDDVDDESSDDTNDNTADADAHNTTGVPHAKAKTKTKRRTRTRRRERPGATIASLQRSRNGPQSLRERLILEQQLLNRRQAELEQQKLRNHPPLDEKGDGADGELGSSGAAAAGLGARLSDGSFSPSPERPSGGGRSVDSIRASLVSPVGVQLPSDLDGTLFFHLQKATPVVDALPCPEPSAASAPWQSPLSESTEQPPLLYQARSSWHEPDAHHSVGMMMTSPPNVPLQGGASFIAAQMGGGAVGVGTSGISAAGSFRDPSTSLVYSSIVTGVAADSHNHHNHRHSAGNVWTGYAQPQEPLPLTNLFPQGPIAVDTDDAFAFPPSASFDHLQRRGTGLLFDVLNSTHTSGSVPLVSASLSQAAAAAAAAAAAGVSERTVQSNSGSPTQHAMDETDAVVHAQSCDVTMVLPSPRQPSNQVPNSSRGMTAEEAREATRLERSRRRRRRTSVAAMNESLTSPRAGTPRRPQAASVRRQQQRRASMLSIVSPLGGTLDETLLAAAAPSRETSPTTSVEKSKDGATPTSAATPASKAPPPASPPPPPPPPLPSNTKSPTPMVTLSASLPQALSVLQPIPTFIRPLSGVVASVVKHNVRQWTTVSTGTLMEIPLRTNAPSPMKAAAASGSSAAADSSAASSTSGLVVARRTVGAALSVRVFVVTAGELLAMVHRVLDCCRTSLSLHQEAAHGSSSSSRADVMKRAAAAASPRSSSRTPSLESACLHDGSDVDEQEKNERNVTRPPQEVASPNSARSNTSVRSVPFPSDDDDDSPDGQHWRLSNFATQHARSSTTQPLPHHSSPRSPPTTASHRYAKSFIQPSKAAAATAAAGENSNGSISEIPTTTRAAVQARSTQSSSLDNDACKSKQPFPARCGSVEAAEDLPSHSSPSLVERFDQTFLTHLEQCLRDLLGFSAPLHMPPRSASVALFGAAMTSDGAATQQQQLGDSPTAPDTTMGSHIYLTLPVLGLQLQMVPYSCFASVGTVSPVTNAIAVRGTRVGTKGRNRSPTLVHHEPTSSVSVVSDQQTRQPQPQSQSPLQTETDTGRRISGGSADAPATATTPGKNAPLRPERYSILSFPSSDLDVRDDNNNNNNNTLRASASATALPKLVTSAALFGNGGDTPSWPAPASCATAALLPPETPVLAIAVAQPTVQPGNIRDAYGKWVSEATPTPVEREYVIRNVIASVLRRLAALHAVGCVHGSVKSTNVFATAHAAQSLIAVTQDATGMIPMATVRTAASTGRRASGTEEPTEASFSVGPSAQRAGVPQYSAALAARPNQAAEWLRLTKGSRHAGEDVDDVLAATSVPLRDPHRGSDDHSGRSGDATRRTPPSGPTTLPRDRTMQSTARPDAPADGSGTAAATAATPVSAEPSAAARARAFSQQRTHSPRAQTASADSSLSSIQSDAPAPPPVVAVDVEGAKDIFRWSADVVLVDEMYSTVERAVRRAVMDVVTGLAEATPQRQSATDPSVKPTTSSNSSLWSMTLPAPLANQATPTAAAASLSSVGLSSAAAALEQWLQTTAQRSGLFPLSQAELIPPPECIVDEQDAAASTDDTHNISEEGSHSPTGVAAFLPSPPPLPQYPYRLHSLNTDSPLPLRSFAADVWMLGMLAVELADGPVPQDLKQRHKPQPALRYRPWSSHFARFVSRCLSVDPAQRPTCAELLKDPWFTVTLMATSTAASTNVGGESERVLSLQQPPRGLPAGSLIRLHRPSATMQQDVAAEKAAADAAQQAEPSAGTRLYLQTSGDICRTFQRHALAWLRTAITASRLKKRRQSNRAAALLKLAGRSSTTVSFVVDDAAAKRDESSVGATPSLSAGKPGVAAVPVSSTASPHNPLLTTQLPEDAWESLRNSPHALLARLGSQRTIDSDANNNNNNNDSCVGKSVRSPLPRSSTCDSDGDDDDESASHHSLTRTLPMANLRDAAAYSPGPASEIPPILMSKQASGDQAPSPQEAAGAPGMTSSLSSSSASTASLFDVASSVWSVSDEDGEASVVSSTATGNKANTARNALGQGPSSASAAAAAAGTGGQASRKSRAPPQSTTTPPVTLSVVTTAVELCRQQARLEAQLFRRHGGSLWNASGAPGGAAATTTTTANTAMVAAARRGSSTNASLIFGGSTSALTSSATATVGPGSGKEPPLHFHALSLATPVAVPAARSGRSDSLSAGPAAGTATATVSPSQCPPSAPQVATTPTSPTTSCASDDSSFFLFSEDEEAVAAEMAGAKPTTTQRPTLPGGDGAGGSTLCGSSTGTGANGVFGAGGIRFEVPPATLWPFDDPDEDEDVLDGSESEKQLTNVQQAFLALYWKHPLAADAWCFQILRHLSKDTRTTELAKELEILLRPTPATNTTGNNNNNNSSNMAPGSPLPRRPTTAGNGEGRTGEAANAAAAGSPDPHADSVSPPAAAPLLKGSGSPAANAQARAEVAPSLFNAFELSKWLVSSAAALESAGRSNKPPHGKTSDPAQTRQSVNR